MPRKRDSNALFWIKLRNAEREIIVDALLEHKTITAAAQNLGVSIPTISERVTALGIKINRDGVKGAAKPKLQVVKAASDEDIDEDAVEEGDDDEEDDEDIDDVEDVDDADDEDVDDDVDDVIEDDEDDDVIEDDDEDEDIKEEEEINKTAKPVKLVKNVEGN